MMITLKKIEFKEGIFLFTYRITSTKLMSEYIFCCDKNEKIMFYKNCLFSFLIISLSFKLNLNLFYLSPISNDDV